MSKEAKQRIFSFIIVFLLFVGYSAWRMQSEPAQTPEISQPSPTAQPSPEPIPEYSGSPFHVINGNVPYFTEDQLSDAAFETYSALDSLGRCGTTMACIGRELMPTEERESISSVIPSGWVNVPYEFVDGGYLYNRCHLIGFQLTGENANECNLITGTRYMNVEGMLPFEDLVADYVWDSGNHVMYRVTPVFEGDELVCRGVIMEGLSVEDDGESVCFNVYVYNVQPGVIINYATGESRMDEEYLSSGQQHEYILNTSSKKFHLPGCSGAESISDKNRQEYTGTRELLIARGYDPCSQCDP